jgi:hypothetical protein
MPDASIAPRAQPPTPRTTSRRVPLRRWEAAEYIRDMHGQPCAAKTLARLGCVGGGPAFRKAGRFVLYERADLDAWARGRLSRKVFRSSESTVAARPRSTARPNALKNNPRR